MYRMEGFCLRSLRLVVIAACTLAVALTTALVVSAAMNPAVGLAWVPYPGNPVLGLGPRGAWDSDHVVGGPVVLVNGTYRTWYVGSGNGTTWGTGTATSTDGIHWDKDAGNPIIPYDGNSQILVENGTYRMWYTYAYPDAYAIPWQVRYSTSPDGIHWTPVVNYSVLNVTAGAWDSATLSPGPVLHNETGYWMWYGATEDGMVWRVGLASSPDGVHWTKYAGNPIIVPPFAGTWDDFRVHPSSILEIRGELVMWYVSDDTDLVQRIGIATSTDGVRWTPSPKPVLDVGASGTWDSGSLSRVFVVQQGDSFQMWFTGRDGTSQFDGHWQIGYATASLEGKSNGGRVSPESVGGSGQDPLGLVSASSGPTSVLLVAAAATFAGAGFGVCAYVAVERLRPRRQV